MKQIDSGHYDYARYMHMSRWSCYYIQVKKTLALKPQSVLEIGPGDGLFGWYMQKNGVDYTSADHADDISSNVKVNLGFEKLPFEDDSFDVVCAFQVLEHIPFDKVPFALSEISRVTKKYAYFDIPQYGKHIQFLLKIPLLKRLSYHAVLPWPVKHEFDGFHYWEVGKKDYSRSIVRSKIQSYFSIVEEFTILENPKERFYLLEKKIN